MPASPSWRSFIVTELQRLLWRLPPPPQRGDVDAADNARIALSCGIAAHRRHLRRCRLIDSRVERAHPIRRASAVGSRSSRNARASLRLLENASVCRAALLPRVAPREAPQTHPRKAAQRLISCAPIVSATSNSPPSARKSSSLLGARKRT